VKCSCDSPQKYGHASYCAYDRLDEAEKVLRLCAGYLADKNAGQAGKFNATARALEDYFGEPSLRRIADTSSVGAADEATGAT
jgi:hypothetical protein